MSGNFEGIKTQKFGVEIECTGLSRKAAAEAIGEILGFSPIHSGGYYDKYFISDAQGGRWTVLYDGSIKPRYRDGRTAPDTYRVEIVTPVLEYEDISLLQDVIRAVRRAGGITGPQYRAGIHIHIDGSPYDARSIRNLVNIFASKENFLFDMLQVAHERESYCKKIDPDFLEKLKATPHSCQNEIKVV